MTQYSGKVIRKTPVTPTQTSASGVWTLTDQAAAIRNNLWPVPGVPDPISRSVRLRSSASAYLNRTFTSVGTRTKFTYSVWLKRGTFGSFQRFFSDSTNNSYFRFDTSDALEWNFWTGTSYTIKTSQVFRDPSAWYHIMVAVDTTQATSSNRVKFYVNGTQVTAFSTASYPAQNDVSNFDNNTAHYISSYSGSAEFFDGYLTEVNFIDGQQLTASSFGTTDTATGAWIPMPYTGTYGTNGFYLNFKDNTSTTTIGYDYSGNSNNWTANNISLTAGSTYDSMLDVPTPWVGYNTGDTTAVTRGNYAVLNSLAATDSSLTYASANLNVSGGGSTLATRCSMSTIAVSSGKWYVEVTVGTTNNGAYCGVIKPSNLGVSRDTCWNYYDGLIYPSGAGSFGTAVSGNIIGIAFDADNGTVQFYKNGSTNGAQQTGLTTGVDWAFYTEMATGGQVQDWNFGQRPFTYTPPTGYKTLVTTNLPTPTITNGANYMAASLYTGNGTSQSINNSVNGVSFQPDFVWVKNRSATYNHCLSNTNVGITYSLSSNLTDAEVNYGNISAVTSTGFSVNGNQLVNGSGNALVGWQWQAGAGTTSSNTSGSITSTVSVNATAGFSVVTYTGTGANVTVGHGLGVAPSMIILKQRNAVDYWVVWQTTLGSTGYLLLNSTNGSSTAATYWNSTTPTSTVFSLGSDSRPNGSGTTYVAYCWAAVAGYSAFGSYTGNGSTDGPFVYCGFRPRYLLIKNASISASWEIIDTSRDPYNVAYHDLYAESSSAESTGTNRLDILSNGFKIRDSNTFLNGSGNTVIFAAFAENPFKYSNAR